MTADEVKDTMPQEIGVQYGDSEFEADVFTPEEIEGGGFIYSKPEIKFKIMDYEEPMALLYDLIKREKISIDDIFVSDITSQYVAIVRSTPKDELDYEYAGDFIRMAADLVYFKSMHILPQEDEEIYDESDPEYEAILFQNKLKEYALMKEQSEKLKELETTNRFYRAPKYTDKDYRVALVNFSLPKLVEAFAKVLANADKHEQAVMPKKVMKERFSVHDQMENIRSIIAVRKEMLFTDLFEFD
ncbi:MAG: segregation/condensation protein A, partial [Clostridia bacterium]|nr:segregation/condensation protein A [Clostridia bacterium]